MSSFRLADDCRLRCRSVLFAALSRAIGSSDLVVSASEIMADLLGDELFALDGFAVALDLEGAHISFGDEAVAFGEA